MNEWLWLTWNNVQTGETPEHPTPCLLKKKKIPELKTEKNHKMYNIFDKVNKSGLNVKKHKNLGDVLYSGYKRSDFIKRKK